VAAYTHRMLTGPEDVDSRKEINLSIPNVGGSREVSQYILASGAPHDLLVLTVGGLNALGTPAPDLLLWFTS
jgi:hypothetical protein